jgi:hypothetical protein
MVKGLVDVAGGFAGGRAVRPGGVRQWRGSESGRSAVPGRREAAAHRVSKLRGAAFTSGDGTGGGAQGPAARYWTCSTTGRTAAGGASPTRWMPSRRRGLCRPRGGQSRLIPIGGMAAPFTRQQAGDTSRKSQEGRPEMSELDELVARPGVLMAGRFGADGRVAEHKTTGLSGPSRQRRGHPSYACRSAPSPTVRRGSAANGRTLRVPTGRVIVMALNRGGGRPGRQRDRASQKRSGHRHLSGSRLA